MSSSVVEAGNSPPHPMGRLLPFQTPRLILRAATHDDVPNCLSRALDPECVQFLPHLNHKNHTAETCRRWIDHMENVRHDGKGLWLIVERREDGEVIGDGGIGEVFWQDTEGKRQEKFEEGKGLTLCGDGGLMLASGSHIRGRGYADEAMTGILQMAFEGGEDGKGMGLDEARAVTLARNPGFAKLARRLEMRESERTSPSGTEERWFRLMRQEWEEGHSKGKWDINAFRGK